MKYREIYVLSYEATIDGKYNEDLISSLNKKLSSYRGRGITWVDNKEYTTVRVCINSTEKLDESLLTVIHNEINIYEKIISHEMYILPHKVPYE